jgi:hypothetical protein
MNPSIKFEPGNQPEWETDFLFFNTENVIMNDPKVAVQGLIQALGFFQSVR